MSDAPDLKGFAEAVMRSWPHGDVDGGDLQDIAVKHGLLREESRTDFCGEFCGCRECFVDPNLDAPWTCYRRVTL
jgi:hypothetical protein